MSGGFLTPRPDGGPLIKVCGLREPANLAAVTAAGPDLVGLIFARQSPRCVDEAQLAPEVVRALPTAVKKVGVFVDEDPTRILAVAARYGLHAAQLHGQETPATCAALQAAGLAVLKAVPVGSAGPDFNALAPYAPHVAGFVFDTAGPRAGGNGHAFNWQLLAGYPFATPWLLAGGLRPDHAAALRELRLPGLAGFDLNSGFETTPGHKDVAALTGFLQEIR